MTERSIALVTGGAQGIGYACGEAIAEDGARVVLADINEDGVVAAAEKLGDGAVGLACDMGKPEQIAALFDRVESDIGPVSILVNNAGIAAPGDFLETSLEQFRKVIDVNLTGTFLALQRAAKTMVAKDIAGSIVNMSSLAGLGWQKSLAACKAFIADATFDNLEEMVEKYEAHGARSYFFSKEILWVWTMQRSPDGL